jgi:hypothetical protein
MGSPAILKYLLNVDRMRSIRFPMAKNSWEFRAVGGIVPPARASARSTPHASFDLPLLLSWNPISA